MTGFSDSDWGGNLDDRRSTTGYCFIFNNAAVCWKSKKQQTVALSSTEAEYMAISAAVQEGLWLKAFLKEINEYNQEELIINEDNQGCIAITKNPENHQRTKHIDIKYHFIREKVENKEILVKYCPTEYNCADILTKSINFTQFQKFTKALGVQTKDF